MSRDAEKRGEGGGIRSVKRSLSLTLALPPHITLSGNSEVASRIWASAVYALNGGDVRYAGDLIEAMATASTFTENDLIARYKFSSSKSNTQVREHITTTKIEHHYGRG